MLLEVVAGPLLEAGHAGAAAAKAMQMPGEDALCPVRVRCSAGAVEGCAVEGCAATLLHGHFPALPRDDPSAATELEPPPLEKKPWGSPSPSSRRACRCADAPSLPYATPKAP